MKENPQTFSSARPTDCISNDTPATYRSRNPQSIHKIETVSLEADKASCLGSGCHLPHLDCLTLQERPRPDLGPIPSKLAGFVADRHEICRTFESRQESDVVLKKALAD